MEAAQAAKDEEVATKEAAAAQVVEQAQALVTELSTLKNEWKPEGRTKVNTVVDKVGSVDLARVKEIREKLKSNDK